MEISDIIDYLIRMAFWALVALGGFGVAYAGAVFALRAYRRDGPPAYVAAGSVGALVGVFVCESAIGHVIFILDYGFLSNML